MKKTISIAILALVASSVFSQTVRNTSYINSSNEKVLRLETILPIDLKTSWSLFTKDEKLKKWIAPLAHIELRSGGYLVTNYDSTKNLSDESSIKLPVLSFVENELIVFKVNLNGNFPESARKSDENLQEVIQFKKINNKHTRIISSMIGWGKGADWDKTFEYFARGNEWTYKELLKNYK
jgi:uncharacterized protein YndB with AHSA1/START domain